MAEFDWGLGSQSQGMKDQSSLILNSLTADKQRGEIAAQPTELAYKQALAQEAMARTGKTAFELQQAQKLYAARMQAATQTPAAGGAPGAQLSGPADPMDAFAPMLNALTVTAKSEIDSGFTKEGGETVKKIMDIVHVGSQIREKNEKLADDKFKQAQVEVKAAAELLQGATDQTTWDRSNAMYTLLTGKQSKFAGMQFTPEVKALAEKELLSYKERLTLDRQDAQQKALEGEYKSRDRARTIRAGIAAANLKVAQAAETRRSKAGEGEKPDKFPATGEIGAAKSLIIGEYKDSLLPAELNNFAVSVAAQAKRLVRLNPAMTTDMALQQAFTNEKKNVTKEESFFGLGSDKHRFTGGGTSPATALTIPSDGKGTPIEGKYYQKGGVVKRWVDGAWETPKAVRRESGDSFSRPPEESED